MNSGSSICRVSRPNFRSPHTALDQVLANGKDKIEKRIKVVEMLELHTEPCLSHDHSQVGKMLPQ